MLLQAWHFPQCQRLCAQAACLCTVDTEPSGPAAMTLGSDDLFAWTGRETSNVHSATKSVFLAASKLFGLFGLVLGRKRSCWPGVLMGMMSGP